MIVVATEDFEVYHGVLAELRDRGTPFTTIEPDEELPARTRVVITGEANVDRFGGEVPTVVATPDDPRLAVDRALATRSGDGGRVVVGVDPGRNPGIAVLVGDLVVAAFQVPLADAVAAIEAEVSDEPDAVVRVGDGSRLESAKLINELSDVTVELVDETGTTPHLGTGTRGMGDVLAAVNIARREGEPTDRRSVDPTAGELQLIKDRSRERSETNRTIDEALARKVASGELELDEALARHAERDGSS